MPMSVDVGEDASFSCAWRGNPLPRITWTRRGGTQVKAPLGPIVVAGIGPGSLANPDPDTSPLSQVLAFGPMLRLPSVGPEDAGDYQCRAEPGPSGRGGGAADARLTVNGAATHTGFYRSPRGRGPGRGVGGIGNGAL